MPVMEICVYKDVPVPSDSVIDCTLVYGADATQEILHPPDHERAADDLFGAEKVL